MTQRARFLRRSWSIPRCASEARSGRLDAVGVGLLYAGSNHAEHHGIPFMPSERCTFGAANYSGSLKLTFIGKF
jgi:hypothetical protein